MARSRESHVMYFSPVFYRSAFPGTGHPAGRPLSNEDDFKIYADVNSRFTHLQGAIDDIEELCLANGGILLSKHLDFTKDIADSGFLVGPACVLNTTELGINRATSRVICLETATQQLESFLRSMMVAYSGNPQLSWRDGHGKFWQEGYTYT